MSGVTDAPFRRLAARLGAGLVVSEMTACAKLVEGRRDALLRAEGQGVGLHVVQLAGCEPHWMAEGARIAEGNGADDHRHQHGLPGAARHRRRVGLGADARSRPCADPDRGDGRRGVGAGDAEDAARLGRALASMRPSLRAAPKRAGVRLITVHGRTRCQFYKGARRLGGGPRGEAGGVDPGRRQRRHRKLRGCRRGARGLGRRRRHGRARRAGQAVAARAARALSRDRARANPRRRWRCSSR